MLLRIEHTSTYRYAVPVQFGPHRLMVRPIESHDVQIRSSGLAIQPAHRVRWMHDVFGNSIAIVDFLEASDTLVVKSTLAVEQYNTNPYDFVLDSHALELPFEYAPIEARDVAPYLHREHPADAEAMRHWMKPFLNLQGRARTLEFLTSINKSFPLFFQYTRRDEPGVQSPGETLRRRAGSCRDFTMLLMEAARQLGLASRYVSGYICHQLGDHADPAFNTTHAWAEIYLPGAGWKGFDPTHAILAADLHVRVAVARHPSQATPVAGTFAGRMQDYRGTEVTVDARVKNEA